MNPKETPRPDANTAVLIERLQRSNRRWKSLALGLLAALALAILSLTISTVVFWHQAEQERRQAEAAEAEAKRQAQEARNDLAKTNETLTWTASDLKRSRDDLETALARSVLGPLAVQGGTRIFGSWEGLRNGFSPFFG